MLTDVPAQLAYWSVCNSIWATRMLLLRKSLISNALLVALLLNFSPASAADPILVKRDQLECLAANADLYLSLEMDTIIFFGDVCPIPDPSPEQLTRTLDNSTLPVVRLKPEADAPVEIETIIVLEKREVACIRDQLDAITAPDPEHGIGVVILNLDACH